MIKLTYKVELKLNGTYTSQDENKGKNLNENLQTPHEMGLFASIHDEFSQFYISNVKQGISNVE